jgi:uncharacterized protein
VLPAIVVPAADIDTSGMALDVELSPEWVTTHVEDASARAESSGRFVGRLSKSGKADVVVRGQVLATVIVACARCLKPVTVDVKTELSLLLKPKAGAGDARPKPGAGARAGAARGGGAAARARPDEYEFASEEAEIDEYDGERVVLDPFVREAILLELPSFPLCSEACPGIAPSESSPGDEPGEEVRPGVTAERRAPERPNPFAVLRGLLTGGAENGEGEADANAARRPSAKEVRRVARQKSKARPKIQSSIKSRGKK